MDALVFACVYALERICIHFRLFSVCLAHVGSLLSSTGEVLRA